MIRRAVLCLVLAGCNPSEETSQGSPPRFETTSQALTATWLPALMHEARSQHAATLMPNGRLLITGGASPFAQSAEEYDPATGVFTTVGTMMFPHTAHATVVLSDGRVLVVGGGIDATEIYDPVTQSFGSPASLPVALTNPVAILLSSSHYYGQVLVVGGDASTTSTALFQLDGGWTPGPSTVDYRASTTWTVLDDIESDHILLAGGGPTMYSTPLSKRTEIFDPDPFSPGWLDGGMLIPAAAPNGLVQGAVARLPDAGIVYAGGFDLVGSGYSTTLDTCVRTNNQWTCGVASCPSVRRGATATAVLADGTWILAGGYNGTAGMNYPSNTADEFVNGAYSTTTMPGDNHVLAPMALLPSGRAMVLFGANNASGSTFTADYEELETATPVSSNGGALPTGVISPTLTRLSDGRVLVAGGLSGVGTPTSSSAIVSADGSQATTVSAMSDARSLHTATLLNDGRVLIVGGLLADGGVTATAEVFSPASGSRTLTTMATARADHSATALPSGEVAVIGGFGADGGTLTSIEIFDPSTEQWSAGPSLLAARAGHRVLLAPSGDLFIIGGGVSLTELWTGAPAGRRSFRAPSTQRCVGPTSA